MSPARNFSSDSVASPRSLQIRRSAIQTLEPLLLLSGSSVEIHAAGQEGLETMALLIDGELVETYENVAQDGAVYTFEAEGPLTADQIRVAFVNDRYEPDTGLDYNLIVDRIVIDDLTFETEHPSVFGTGVWTGESFVPGFHETELLSGNGFFQFASLSGNPATTLDVVARGKTGAEIMRVSAEGAILAEFEVTQSLQTYTVNSDIFSPGDDLRVEFVNDFYDPSAGVDRNLIVDQIRVDGVPYQTESPNVFSTGTITADGTAQPGFHQSEVLHTNGYFEFPTQQNSIPAPVDRPSTIQVVAYGDEGTELMHVFVGEQFVQQFAVTTEAQIFSFTTNTFDAGDEIRVEFVNDFYDPAAGIDANLRIESVSVDGQTNVSSKFLLANGFVEYAFEEVGPEYRSIDGTGNHLFEDELGSAGEFLTRLSDPEYADGTAAVIDDRPGARDISNQIVAQETAEKNRRGLSDIAWLWGQFIDHDISLSGSAEPHEPVDIPVPEGDVHFDPFGTGAATIEANRTLHGTSEAGYREQINEITAWIDGSMVYGSDDVRAAALRSLDGGRLIVTEDGLMPFNDSGLPNAADGVAPGTDLFLGGDVRANENVALASMHTLWVREHNLLADELAARDATLTDEQLYQQAREFVIAQIQAITFNEFLPAILGANAVNDYAGYDPDADPTIANEFSTAAYRFGHTMLSQQLMRLNADGSEAEEGYIALRDAFFSPNEVVEHGIDSLLIGAASQLANEIDNQIIDDVRNFLFGPPGAGGFDLATLNIFRGRDHGLASYNQVREDIGLGRVNDFSDVSSDVDVQARLQAVYGSVDDIDLWVGGLAEDHVDGGSLGETFQRIIVQQFEQLRSADRFWYENRLAESEVEWVNGNSLADIIERNTTADNLQGNVFFA